MLELCLLAIYMYEQSDPCRVLLPQPEPPPPPPPGGCPAIGLGGHRAPSCLSLALLALYALALLPALALLARRLRTGAQNPVGNASGGFSGDPGVAGGGGLLGRLRVLLPPYGRSGGAAGTEGTADGGAAEPLLSGSAEVSGHEAAEGGKGGGVEPWVGGGADAAGWEADEASDEAFPWVERHLRCWFRKQARLPEPMYCTSYAFLYHGNTSAQVKSLGARHVMASHCASHAY